MLHWLAWVLARVVYGLRIVGREHLPATGPVLLVSNHVSYVDWLVLLAASPRRIRFVIASNFLSKPLIGWILRFVRVIPIERRGGPKSLTRTLDAASQALRNGEVVCVFPEGYPTRSGVMLPFHRGFERIVKNAPAPIVPVYVDQLWGSIFSYKGGRLFWKWPQRRKYPVRVAFGEPQKAGLSASHCRHIVEELAASVAKQRTRDTMPLHRQLVRSAARRPFRVCLIDTNVDPPRVLNRAKVVAGAECFAKWLRPVIGDSPMVGVWLPQSVGAAVVNVALAFLRKTAVNLNYTAGGDNVRSAVRQCGLRHVVTAKRFLHRVPLDLGPDVQVIHIEDALAAVTNLRRAVAYLRTILLPGWLLDWWLGLGSHRVSDLATVIFSSGSTGEPKGIMLSQQNIAANVEAFVEFVDFSPQDRVLGMLPFFHSFGYTVTLWGALTAEARTVFHPDPRAAKEIGELCRNYGCTLMAATATFLRLYLRRCQPEDFKSMQLLVCGAEKLPPSLIQEFQAKFGVEPREGYGCTELSPVVGVNIPDRLVNNVKQIGTKIGTIGHPLPGVAARVVNPDTDEQRDFGEEGLLLITGPNVMQGYLGRDDQTRAKIRNGWYDTGDMGRIDEDGFITLTGRLARFAKIAGEMIPLELIEEELHKLLGTSDRVLAIVAVPDKKRGERVIVLYLPSEKLNMSTLLNELGKSGLPNLWIPDARDAYAVTELPVLGSGKLDLQKLRDLAMSSAGIDKN